MPFIKVEAVSIILFLISFFALMSGSSIIKSIIAIGLMETAVVLFFLSIGFTEGNTAPIGQNLENVSDPLPQALVITAIIIGVTVTAVNLIMFITLYRKYKTTNWEYNKEIETG